MAAQAAQLVHGLGDVHPSPLKASLCQAISRITFERWNEGPAKTILCNSGSDSVEAALKTALLHSGKPGVISFTGGYHGLGHGALETCGLPYFSGLPHAEPRSKPDLDQILAGGGKRQEPPV